MSATNIRQFLKQVKTLVEYHESMGITDYPLTPELANFLGPAEPMTAAPPMPAAPVKSARRPETPGPAAAASPPAPESAAPPRVATIRGETLEEINREIRDCAHCRLHQGRGQVVAGQGTGRAGLLIVGEWPGPEDDLRDTPLAGEAGDLLANMLKAIKLDRADVFITLAVKCKTPDNREPQPDEIQNCQAILRRQIKAVRPKVICTMGQLAAQALLNTRKPLFQLRGHFHKHEGIPVMPTLHPAFLLKNPEFKKAVWLDLQLIQKKLASLPK